MLLLWYLQRHRSRSTHTPSCSIMSPGQPQDGLHPRTSTHSVSPWRSEQERGQGFPHGQNSWPPPQSEETREKLMWGDRIWLSVSCIWWNDVPVQTVMLSWQPRVCRVSPWHGRPPNLAGGLLHTRCLTDTPSHTSQSDHEPQELHEPSTTHTHGPNKHRTFP